MRLDESQRVSPFGIRALDLKKAHSELQRSLSVDSMEDNSVGIGDVELDGQLLAGGFLEALVPRMASLLGRSFKRSQARFQRLLDSELSCVNF